MKTWQERVDKLNDLITICKNGERGFRLAASEVKNQQKRELLETTARQRAIYAAQLQDLVKKMGGIPMREDNLVGRLHRGWMSLRHGIDHRDQAVMRECKRGEEVALKAYEDLFENKIVPDAEAICEKQYVNMIEVRDWLSDQVGNKSSDESVLHLQ